MRVGVLLIALLAALGWADDKITLISLNGSDVELQPAEGQMLLVHFWATWCPTCIDDIRDLQDAAADCSKQRMNVVLVNVGEDDDVVREFVDQHDVRLQVLRDPKGRLWRRTEGRGLPANLFWSNRGSRTDVGPKPEGEWRRLLASHGCSALGSGE